MSETMWVIGIAIGILAGGIAGIGLGIRWGLMKEDDAKRRAERYESLAESYRATTIELTRRQWEVAKKLRQDGLDPKKYGLEFLEVECSTVSSGGDPFLTVTPADFGLDETLVEGGKDPDKTP